MAVAQPDTQVIVQQVVEYINLHILQHWQQQVVEEAQQRLAATQPLSDVNNDLIRHLVRVEEGLKALSEQMDKRFEQVDKRFEQVDKRFEQMDKRFTEQREYTDKRFEEMNLRFAEQREDTNRRFAEQREDTNRRFAEQREDITKNSKRITFFSTVIIAFVTASLILLGIVLSRIGA